MDPTLISAAARLCGWIHEGRRRRWMTADEKQWVTEGDTLTDAGLLALEAELKKRGWFWIPDTVNWCWTKPASVVFKAHADRATAACLAAQEEVGDA